MGEVHDDKSKDESKVCRLCFSSTDVTVHIGRHDNNSASIVEKIHYCTSVVVKLNDGFHQNICTKCTENLESMYSFKSKAIACDLELSKNVHRDMEFTYVQVSDDPLNMTYKLCLEDQDSSTDLVDSCVYNIVDGDELTIEPVNVVPKNKNIVTIDQNKSTVSEHLRNDYDEMQNSTKIKLIGNSNNNENTKTIDQKEKANSNVKRNLDKSLSNDEQKTQKKMKIDNYLDDEKPSLVVKNGKVVYICGVCSFEAESMSSLLSHRTRNHLDMGSYKCSECPTYYKTQGLLKRHMSLHNDIVHHMCKHCDKKFFNKQGLDRHMNCSHNKIPLEFQCVKCNAYFETMDKMEDHLVVHYMSPSSSFICNHCDRSFTTYAAKNKHIDLEHMIEIECDICHVVLPTKEAMDKHNNSVHQPKKKGNKTYACTTCGKCFSSIKDVLSHREIHLSSNNV